MRNPLAKPHSDLILAFAAASVLVFALQRSAPKPAVTSAATDHFIGPDAPLSTAAEQRSVSPINVSIQLVADIPQWSLKELRRQHRRLQLEGHPGYALASAVMETEMRRMTMNRSWQWDGTLAHTDPDAAWALAWNTGPTYRRGEWLGNALKAIRNAHGAETALMYLEKIDDPDLRHSLAQEVVTDAAEQSPELSASLREKYPEWRSLIRARAMQGLAKTQPIQALESANRLPLSERLWTTDAVLEQWLLSNPDAALAWIKAQPDAAFHPLGNALGAMAATDPLTALDSALTTGMRTERLSLLSGVMRNAIEADGENGEVVCKWVHENLNATEIAEVVSEAANFRGADPPVWQRELAASALEQMDDVTRVSTMVREWGDFDAKRTWVAALPEVPRRKMSGVLLPEWSVRNSREAADMMRQIPTPEGRSLVLRTGIESAQDREAFVRWAAEVTGGDAGTRALVPELQKLDAEGER
ncbi:MAG: hypothetical protein KDN22_23930 [Verrucomicrobiae bacterium]|nr:hypothetical protein [Verrucomicrobiae bacterium]